jgi:trehalose 6-phosphate synthase/phosphatase
VIVQRLLIVANRLPVTAHSEGGRLVLEPSIGGLATGIGSFYRKYDSLWIGWYEPPEGEAGEFGPEAVKTRLMEEHDSKPVFIPPEEALAYYEGTLWPTFHYFTQYARFEEEWWNAYARVNRRFCDAVLEVARPDDTIWIHDYHLMLLPGMLRERLPNASIGFFLHIPFPSFEIFGMLPWRTELVRGLLGADLVGFHTYDYVRHFLSSVLRLTGLEHVLGEISVGRRRIKVDAFPMGIDYPAFSQSRDLPEVHDEMARMRAEVGEHRVILSVDRLDYTKGILHRLEAYDTFLAEHPEHQGHVVLALVTVPSRTDASDYQQLKRDVDEMVGRISGKYLSGSLPFERLAALYAIAEVILVTPLRDGMNLVAKEYVATHDEEGVLILSEMAGAAKELGEAIVVNPFNRSEMAAAIETALAMPAEERRDRMTAMKKRLLRYDVVRWAADFTDSLTLECGRERALRSRLLTDAVEEQMAEQYHSATRRLILLDYDGTLVGFANKPSHARPDAELLDLLAKLDSDPANEVVIVSGRDRVTMSQWLGDLPLSLITDHGAWIRERGEDWKTLTPLTGDWKESVRPVMERYIDRTPGSLLEEKEFSLVWHYRAADPFMGQTRARELRESLEHLTANRDLGVMEGNKALEVKNAGVNKGLAASTWLSREPWDFILAIGDDRTDEDLFATLPDCACSIRVGWGPSNATHYADGVADVREFLTRLAR